MKPRNYTSWVDGFYDYTNILSSPSLWRKWVGIMTVAGVLERKVWIRSLGSNLYPNMYVVLVGPPGAGKTMLTSVTHNMWSELVDDGHHLASSSITKAALIDDLRDAERKVIRPASANPVEIFNSLKICSNELGTLLPSYDNEFMSVLTDLWDNHSYSERRRTKDLQFTIANPQLNMLAATTPSYLTSILPPGAWDQGFLARTLLVFSSETVRRPLFAESTADETAYKKLVEDLRRIGKLDGKMTFEPAAAQLLEDWHMSGGDPIPEHPKLIHYVTRRTAHLLKLCMVASAQLTDDLIITLDHVQIALDWLIEVEQYMPDIFKAMAKGGDGQAIEDCWYFVYELYMKERKPIAEHRVIYFLQSRVPTYSVNTIIEVMQRSGMLTKEGGSFIPKKPSH